MNAKKNNGGAAHHPTDSVRQERLPVGRVNHKSAERNYEDDDRDLDNDDDRVCARAFADSVNQ
jgi:hypothetical protein